MYLSSQEIRKFEDSIGFEVLCAKNEEIGKFLDFKPEVTYSVGDGDGSCYHPDQRYFSTPESQKAEAERWLADNLKRFPDGWVAKDGYFVKKNEWWPRFHIDWNHLMEAVKRMRQKGINVGHNTDIFYTWKLVSQNCK